MRDHRQVVEGVIYRYRCGIAWRDLPTSFGPWQTVWKRHRRFSGDGTWDKVLAELLAQADAVKEIDWTGACQVFCVSGRSVVHREGSIRSG
jgi:transposase